MYVPTGNQSRDNANLKIRDDLRAQQAEEGKDAVTKYPAGTAGGVIIPLLLGEAFKRGAPLMRSGAAGIDNFAIGATEGDKAYGANPGKSLSTNRITGWTPNGLLGKVNDAIPKASADYRAIVSKNPTGGTINTGSILSDPFGSIIADKTNPRTGVAAPSQIRKAGATQRLLGHVMDPQTGNPTPMFRSPYLTPLEATDLKSNIYGMTDYDNPSKSALSNKGLKAAAHGLKSEIESVVPGSVAPGQNLHNLMAAKDILEPAARSQKLPGSKSGLVQAGMRKGLTTAAAGMDVTGVGMGRASLPVKYLSLLPLLSPWQKSRD
jgi:hypothetical protein